MKKNDSAEKAALLTELFGEGRIADLRKSGVLPSQEAKASDPAAAERYRNRLIERFRERGLISGMAPAGQTETAQSGKKRVNPAPNRTTTEFLPGAIGARLAKHLDAQRLSDEHPAVIAFFLRTQTPQLRSQVLRGLPGSQARSVMRILRGGNPQPVAKKAKTEVPDQVKEPEENLSANQEELLQSTPRRTANTRRAL